MLIYNNTALGNVITDRMKRLLWIGMLLIVLQARAQFDVAFTNSWALQSWYNPAAAGVYGKLDIHGVYSQQMAGFSGAPATMALTGDLPLWFFGPSHGAGLGFMNDKAGLFTTKKIYLQYAYHQKLGKGKLSVGLRPVILTEGFDGSKVDVEEGNDPALPKTKVNGNSVDIGAGVYYMHGAWYVGVSAQHLTSPKIELGETNEIDISPVYYLTGGYNIKLRNPFLSVKPSALVKYDGVAWRGDVSCRLVYTHEKKMLYGGISYSPTNSVTGLIGGRFHGVVLGYSYEFYTSAISPGNGSHELFVGYQTDINLVKKGRNKHKSVRIL